MQQLCVISSFRQKLADLEQMYVVLVQLLNRMLTYILGLRWFSWQGWSSLATVIVAESVF